MKPYPKHKAIKLIDCRDMDEFLKEQLGKPWDTLESERDGACSGNGVITSYEAFHDPEHAYSVERCSLVEDWLNGGDTYDSDLSTSDLLCYLVEQGKIESGYYWVHLWW